MSCLLCDADDRCLKYGPEALEQGATIVDVFYDYKALAKATFDSIVEYKKTGKKEKSIMINPVAVTKDNCADYK